MISLGRIGVNRPVKKVDHYEVFITRYGAREVYLETKSLEKACRMAERQAQILPEPVLGVSSGVLAVVANGNKTLIYTVLRNPDGIVIDSDIMCHRG